MYRSVAQSNETARGMLQNALEMRHAARAMEWVRTMIQSGSLRPGDRLPPERELVRMLRTNRAGVRAAIEYLATIGVLKIRHGSGTIVAIDGEELNALSSDLEGAPRQSEIGYFYEARAALEGGIAALAAKQRDIRFWPKLAEELTELYASVDTPREYLVHEMVFHRTIAQATNNPALSALMAKITMAFYGACRDEDEFEQDLQSSAHRHRKIYRAIRDGKPEEARIAMEEHLRLSAHAHRCSQLPEETSRMAG